MKDERIFYAVQETNNDEWDCGSYDFSEAVDMLKAQGRGLIAVIDTYDSFCLAEYSYEQVEQYEQTKDICIGGVFVGR